MSKTLPSLADYFTETAERDPQIRAGQHAFNVLFTMRPDLSERVRGRSGLDPFYRDELLLEFYEFVIENW